MNPIVKLGHYVRRIRLLVDSGYYPEYLRKQGVRIGRNCVILYPSYIDGRLPYLLEIGDDVVISLYVTILTHDAASAWAGDLVKVGRVRIHDHVFIGANTTVMCNVTIGPHAIVGAGSVVSRDVPPNSVVAGNPAKVVCSMDQFTAKHRELGGRQPLFEGKDFRHPYISDDRKTFLSEQLRDTFGYFCSRLPDSRPETIPSAGKGRQEGDKK
ncbi:MAG: acyltransferase [Deltaproteobacteria bacterium]|jgi:maltose O-acetyltransferase|nr:acyltransferase [Deltaproteobacteria bacterium]MBW2479654.1 acyltransferase [Deltaproteobacteria bacterium]